MMDPRRLFTFLLPKTGVCEEKTLYYRTEDDVTLKDGALFLSAGASVSFDCYFNVFDYALFRDDTPIEKVSYRLSFQGNLTLRLCLLRAAENEQGYERITLSERRVSSSEKTETVLSLPLRDLAGKGSIYLSLQAESESVFYGGEIEGDRDPLRVVKIGVAITTYKRESYVKRNVATLVRELPSDRFGVFVTDNGNTLSPQDVNGATLIPNKNLGGSSGFARGIMEIQKREGYTHILLTDDDISFEPEIFLRTAAILSYLLDAENVIVGASMLFSDDPAFQNELGAVWTGHRQLPQNKFIRVDDPLSLVKNANYPLPDYSGWWYNCIPLSLTKRIGLPFPFFIKIDDAEYCIRAHAKILLLNGIGVWHECFDYKYQSSLEYYHTRNGLILNALHYKKRGALHAFVTLICNVAKQIVLQRYRTADLIFRAFDDFLKGANAYAALDAAALHRELATLGEGGIPREELLAQGYDLSSPLHREQRGSFTFSIKQAITLNGYLLPAKKEGYRVVDVTASKPDFFYRARRVVQYNPITQKGFVTEQKRGVLFKTGLRLIGYFFKLLFRFRKASRSFRESFPEMISERAWRERLDLPLD